MSETHAKYLGEGVVCAYCGEHKIGAVLKKVKMISLEDVYFNETEIVVDPLKTPKDQVWEAIKDNIPEPYEAVQCPMCNETVDPEWNDEICEGALWECTDCNEVHEGEDAAEECCEYTRRYAKENQRYVQQRVEEARQLLESQGFSVNRPMTQDQANISMADIMRKVY